MAQSKPIKRTFNRLSKSIDKKTNGKGRVLHAVRIDLRNSLFLVFLCARVGLDFSEIINRTIANRFAVELDAIDKIIETKRNEGLDNDAILRFLRELGASLFDDGGYVLPGFEKPNGVMRNAKVIDTSRYGGHREKQNK